MAAPAYRLGPAPPRRRRRDRHRGVRDGEGAKRQLVFEPIELGLPIASRRDQPDGGLAFDLVTGPTDRVVIGHDRGVITLNLAENDDACGEPTRTQLGEAYRTLLGHFRHEIAR